MLERVFEESKIVKGKKIAHWNHFRVLSIDDSNHSEDLRLKIMKIRAVKSRISASNLRWLETVSSTFQDLDFHGSL